MKLVFFVLLWIPFQLISQNLVPNPGFENNSQLAKNPATITDDFKYVYGWKLLGWQSFYCHCKTKNPLNDHLSACRNHLYTPKSGCAMIKMVYEESTRTDGAPNAEIEYKGATSYLECKLIEPLVVGEVYEMSFWVFFPANTNVEKSILTHIGFLPTLHYISMSPQSMLVMNRFFGDSIPMGEWFQIKKYIRALCPLEYLVIGAFRNSTFPLVHRFQDFGYPFYFVDDVRVEKINEDSIPDAIIPTPFCRFFDDEKEQLEVPTEQSITVYFETDSSRLSYPQQLRLDSFITEVDKRWEPVYKIVGHTDNIGEKNESLSIERALHTSKFLKAHFEIPEYRFVCFGVGSDKPASSNLTASGRSKNRRVEVGITSLNKLSGLYRYCLSLVKGHNYTKAVAYLKKWIAAANYNEVIYILFDYRFDPLRETKEWKSIYGDIRKKYTKAYASQDAFYLDSLRCEDQRYRTLVLPVLSLSGFFKEYESFRFEHYEIELEKLDSVDKKPLHALMTYLRENPFPKISEVGRRNVQGLIFMLIHSEDTILINHYLPIIVQRCLSGEAEWSTYAMLYDKNLVVKGLPQHYGTQFLFTDESKTKRILAPIDGLKLVNQRRLKLGLAPL